MPAEKLPIQFREATEFFDAAVVGNVGFGWDAPRLRDGRILGGRLLHMGRDKPWGCALRSHFYIGRDLPAAGKRPLEIKDMVSDEFGRSLLQHCYNEFTFLLRFLPSLFIAENRQTHKVALPW